MINNLKNKIFNLLRWSEKWTRTDMVYLTKGGFWLTLAQFFSSFSAFLLALAFANLLPKTVYGTYSYVLSIVGILSFPTLSEMSTALTQAIARGYEGSIRPAVKTKIKWGLLGGLASLLLAGYYYYNNNLTLAFSFLIAGVFIPFFDAFKPANAILTGRKLFKARTKFNLFANIFKTAAMAAVLFLTNNLFFVLLTYFTSNIITKFIIYNIIFYKLKPNNRVDDNALAYGKHLSLINIIGVIPNHIDKIILWHYLGPVQLAIYSFAKAPVDQISGLMQMVKPLAFPKLAASDKKILKATLPNKIFKFMLVAVGLIIIYIAAAPLLYKLFFPNYLNSVYYSQLYAISLIFIPRVLFNQSLLAHRQTKYLYIVNSAIPVIKIALLVPLFLLFKITGIMYAYILAGLFAFFILYYFFKKI